MDSGKWQRVNRHDPCKVCGAGDWCLESADGTAAICPRTESPKRIGDAGWLHRLGDTPTRRGPRTRVVPMRSNEVDHSGFASYCACEAERFGVLPQVAASLGVTAESLERLGVGWMGAERCTTWPLVEHTGQRVTGIVRRFADGSKFLVKGHRAGLYMPRDLAADLSGETLIVCEGGSDVAAALDMGFAAVGRFSCAHGAALLTRLIQQRRPGRVVVVSDTGNTAELRGAESLAAVLSAYSPDVRLIHPPTKDLRAWRQAGAGPGDLRGLIEAATPRRLQVKVAA